MFNHKLPKKEQTINSNVVQALFILHATGPTNFVQRDTIADLVKLQMSDQKQRNKPTDELITHSLKTLTSAGVLAHTGTSEYGLRCVLQYDNAHRPSVTAVSGLRIQRVEPPVKQRLDPNNPTTDFISKKSMSGNNVTKARKQRRCNNKSRPRKPCARTTPAKLNKVRAKVKKNYIPKRNSCKLQAAKKYLTQAFNKIKREERQEQMRLAKAVPVIQEHPLDLSNKNFGHEHNSIKNSLDLKTAKLFPVKTICPVPSGSFEGMPHPPDQTSAIGSTSSRAVDRLDGPNTHDASMTGLNGSQDRGTIPFQRRWSPFWERTSETRSNVDVEQAENQPTWFPMLLPNHEFWFGGPFD